MKRIQVTKAHNFNMRDKNVRVDVRNRIDKFAIYLCDDYNIQSIWRDAQHVDFKCSSGIANGLQGVLTIDNSYITIDLDLPFTMIALSDVLKKAIDEKLSGFIKA